SDATDGILDRVVAGAATEVPLEMERQVLSLLLRKACRGHDHPRSAETALERLGTEKSLLHRMELAVARQSLERGNFAAFGPESGDQATVDRFTVEPDGAGATIAGVTSFLHSKPAQVPQERTQALARKRFGREGSAVDAIIHDGFPDGAPQDLSSERICWA